MRRRLASLRLAAVFISLLIPTPETQGARGAESGGPPLRVVWPPDGATVDGERVRVGGRTDPDAAITVNGQAMRIVPTGAFAGTCPLTVGTNRIVFRAAKDGKSATVARTVRRSEPLRTLPSTPVRFDENYDGQPSEDLEVRPGDTIHIRVKGSPGHKAAFRIGSSEMRYPLFASSRYDVEGFYEGAYQVKATDRFVEARITCYLTSGKGTGSREIQVRVPGKVTVNTNPYPDAARVREDYARLRAEPHRGAPILAARAGTCLAVDGRCGNMLRVALTGTRHGWLPRELVDMGGDEPPLRRGVVNDLSVAESETATMVRIPLGLRVPFVITENPALASLDLTIFGVENSLNWITARTPKGIAEAVNPIHSDDGTCGFRISLHGGRLWGYRGYYDGTTLCLLVRHPLAPASNRAKPLAGRTILLDPGHGGPSKGTLGSTGVAEKVVNAELGRILRGLLEARGARVRMTRPDDEDVSLAGRARQAEEDGDLFVSIHNNSVDLTADPLAARGAGIFYYHPHSREAASAIYRRMVTVEPRPEPYGEIAADLYVVREITAMPSVLLECLFLSNPEDEMLLLDKAFTARYMEKVAEGIADYFAGMK